MVTANAYMYAANYNCTFAASPSQAQYMKDTFNPCVQLYSELAEGQVMQQ